VVFHRILLSGSRGSERKREVLVDIHVDTVDTDHVIATLAAYHRTATTAVGLDVLVLFRLVLLFVFRGELVKVVVAESGSMFDRVRDLVLLVLKNIVIPSQLLVRSLEIVVPLLEIGMTTTGSAQD
jgi:hypothetical protein